MPTRLLAWRRVAGRRLGRAAGGQAEHKQPPHDRGTARCRLQALRRAPLALQGAHNPVVKAVTKAEACNRRYITSQCVEKYFYERSQPRHGVEAWRLRTSCWVRRSYLRVPNPILGTWRVEAGHAPPPWSPPIAHDWAPVESGGALRVWKEAPARQGWPQRASLGTHSHGARQSSSRKYGCMYYPCPVWSLAMSQSALLDPIWRLQLRAPPHRAVRVTCSAA